MALNDLEKQLLNRAADNAEKAHTQAAETRVAVESLASQTAELFNRTRKTENDMVEMQTNYKNCGARKAHDAGVLPGNKSDTAAAFWAKVAGVCAIGGLIGAIASPLIQAILSKIFG